MRRLILAIPRESGAYRKHRWMEVMMTTFAQDWREEAERVFSLHVGYKSTVTETAKDDPFIRVGFSDEKEGGLTWVSALILEDQ